MPTTNSMLPPLPYMRPMAKALPVEYESELSYYEYLNNLYSYINTNVRTVIDTMKIYVDEILPELEDDVAELQTQMTSVLADIHTLQTQSAQHGSAIQLLNTLVDGLNNAVTTLQGHIATINGQLNQHNTQLNNLRNDITAIQTRLGEITTEIATINGRLDTDELNISNNTTEILNLQGYSVSRLRKSTSFTSGFDAWTLEELLPTGTKYSDLFNKKVRIVFDFATGTALTSNQKQTLNIGNSTENKTIDLSKVTTQALTTASKSYVIELEFVKTTNQARFDVFAKSYGDCTTCNYYGGHLSFGQIGYDATVTGLLTFAGLDGTGSVSVYF